MRKGRCDNDLAMARGADRYCQRLARRDHSQYASWVFGNSELTRSGIPRLISRGHIEAARRSSARERSARHSAADQPRPH